MRAILALLLVVMAGCLSSDPAAPDEPTANSGDVDQALPAAAPADGDEPAACADCRVEVDVRRFEIVASAHAGGIEIVSLGNLAASDGLGPVLELGPGATWVQAEVVWSPIKPTTVNLGLLGRACDAYWDDCQTVVAENRTVGPSTLVQTLSGWEREAGMASFTLYAAEAVSGVPVGTVLAQEGTFYTSVFYGFKPPQGWLYTVDGKPEPTSGEPA